MFSFSVPKPSSLNATIGEAMEEIAIMSVNILYINLAEFFDSLRRICLSQRALCCLISLASE